MAQGKSVVGFQVEEGKDSVEVAIRGTFELSIDMSDPESVQTGFAKFRQFLRLIEPMQVDSLLNDLKEQLKEAQAALARGETNHVTTKMFQ